MILKFAEAEGRRISDTTSCIRCPEIFPSQFKSSKFYYLAKKKKDTETVSHKKETINTILSGRYQGSI